MHADKKREVKTSARMERKRMDDIANEIEDAVRNQHMRTVYRLYTS